MVKGRKKKNYKKVIHTKEPLKANDEDDVKTHKMFSSRASQYCYSERELGRARASHFHGVVDNNKVKSINTINWICTESRRGFFRLDFLLQNAPRIAKHLTLISLCAVPTSLMAKHDETEPVSNEALIIHTTTTKSFLSQSEMILMIRRFGWMSLKSMMSESIERDTERSPILF